MPEFERPSIGEPPGESERTEIPPVEPVGLEPGRVDEFVAWASRTGVEERETVREAIQAASGDESLVAELFERFEKATRAGDVGTSLVLLGVVGELRSPDAVKRLLELVWRELPDDQPGHNALGDRDVMEMLQSKAVEGVAYLREDWSDEATREVVSRHPSTPVRAAAIDAYLYNHDDDPATLADVVAPADRPFLDRPRQTRDLDPQTFNERLDRFQEAHPEARPEAPEPTEEKGEGEEDEKGLDEPFEPPEGKGR